MNYTLQRLKPGLHGSHQVDNAALALAVCEILQSSGQAHIPLEAIRHGLKKAHGPGRLEVASEAPLLILDGTHNLMAARVLARHLNDCSHLRFRTGAHHEEHEEHEGHEEWNLVSFRIVLLDVQ